MIQLKILTGQLAGTFWVARQFPVRVGRAAGADLQIEENGVWDEHFQITLQPQEGFVLEAQAQALVSVNGPPARRAILHNGDVIGIGSWKSQFWLSEAVQRRLYLWETFVWLIVFAVTLGQIALVYWLLR